jgi:hypothetical protein
MTNTNTNTKNETVISNVKTVTKGIKNDLTNRGKNADKLQDKFITALIIAESSKNFDPFVQALNHKNITESEQSLLKNWLSEFAPVKFKTLKETNLLTVRLDKSKQAKDFKVQEASKHLWNKKLDKESTKAKYSLEKKLENLSKVIVKNETLDNETRQHIHDMLDGFLDEMLKKAA